ncbi:hypothetical protein [uncultured Psychroserpens sp.]|uniref:hypothetical protein n=1 Tax=uncultured Psychroserpens sp. TaxID=255436 RepID=UPI00261D41A1|nr:hypothetical protein [uncultured Psychroserpens sp.]
MVTLFKIRKSTHSLFLLGALVLMLMLISCGASSVNLEGYTAFEKPVYNDENSHQLNTNGVYIEFTPLHSKFKETRTGFYFDKNGRKCTFQVDSLFWSAPNTYLEKTAKNDYFKNGYFDNYYVHNDTLTVQSFGTNKNAYHKKWTVEENYQILNKDTLSALNYISYGGGALDKPKEEKAKKTRLFKFYKTDNVPNCNNAWFINETWYTEKLHKTRKH